MKFPKVGMRVIKTVIAVFLSISIYIILLLIDKITHLNISSIYTPFFAGIAAVYTLHKGRKSSLTLAKARSFGSIVGGYYGLIIVLLSDLVLKDLLNLDTFNNYLYLLILYIIVSVSMILLIQFTIFTKQNSSVFITCLTFLSVTISSRNGGMNVILFANNRIISTIIGIGISLLINNFSIFINKNKDILFVSTLDNNILVKKNEDISLYIKYKLNHLFYKDMSLTFATTRTLSSLEYIFNNVELEFPVVVMNGAALYDFKDKQYHDVYSINNDARIFIDEQINKLDLNSFSYSIEDNISHAFYKNLNNEAEQHFYKIRRKNEFDNFVRATPPLDAKISLYILIDKKDKIDKLASSLENSIYSKYLTIVSYPFVGVDGEYYYLKISSNDSSKEVLTNKLKEEGKFKKLIVCGSGKTDIGLIKSADFSFCLNTAPEHVQKEVDIVIGSNPEDILKIFEKLYHTFNVDKKIEKLKNQYKK